MLTSHAKSLTHTERAPFPPWPLFGFSLERERWKAKVHYRDPDRDPSRDIGRAGPLPSHSLHSACASAVL